MQRGYPNFIPSICIFLSTLGIAAVLMGCFPAPEDVMEQTVQEFQFFAYSNYTYSSFATATNALKSYVAFLSDNERQLAEEFDVLVLLNVSNGMLAYMMMHAGSTEEALTCLSMSYDFHSRSLINGGGKPIPKADYIGWLLDARGKIDLQTPPVWKQEISMDSTRLLVIRSAWRTNDFK